jgi:hypothetical protein
MKKNFMYAMMSAIALTGAVGFSACSTSDEIAEEVKVTGETVKTQFAIGITSEANATTRMAEATAQAQVAPVFRGMQDIILIPFDREPGDETYRIGKYIQPGEGKIATDLSVAEADREVTVTDASHKLTSTANYVVYSDVEVPVGTTHFLFYGHAPADGFTKGHLRTTDAYLESADMATANGKFVNPQTSLVFSPTPIYPGHDNDVAAGNAKGLALITLLNTVAAAKANVTVGTTTTEKTWASVTADENGLLNQLYNNFKTQTSGSSFNVHRALQDLYYSVNNLAGTTDNPYSAIASAIQTAIQTGGNTASTDAKTLTFDSQYTGYPADLNLPEGAAKIKWSGSAFVDALKTDGDNIGAITTSTTPVTVYSTYAYPADLWYWKSTSIHASNQIESTNFGDKTWASIISTEYSGDPTVVSGSTKSVALDGQIRYAVGRLDLSINEFPSTSTITDYKLNVMDFSKPYQADASYPTPGTDDTGARNGFQGEITLTGVLIGYQHAVDWQFLPTGTTEYVIYDRIMNNGTNPIVPLKQSTSSTLSDCGTNHTLVLETEAGKNVNIALQFVSNGADFYGKNGQLIPSGGTFYLAGTLDLAEKSPSGSTLNQVFKQHYITKVNLSILPGGTDGNGDGKPDTPAGFQEATNTIPDLRTSQMELCFSVDLTWDEGLTFNPSW